MEASVTDIHLEIPPTVLDALNALETQGYETWLVGGCVRDAILGRPLHDFDLATAAPWQIGEQILTNAGFDIHRTGEKHGTITAVRDDLALEITTFRIDGSYSDGRHPDTVEQARSIHEDILRRDYSVNALAYHPERGLLDEVDGLQDLENHLLRTVGNPEKRFDEDGLRILRGLRFASELGFTLDEQTFQAMKRYKMKLASVSAERITAEMDRLLLGPAVQPTLMRAIDVLGAIMPEIVSCKDFNQHTPYHIYSVWEHISWAVHYVEPTRLGRWAAFFHDVGKPGAFYLDGDRGHFYEHAKLSVIIAREVMERLLFSPAFIQQVLTLIRVHDHQIPATPQGVKRMLNKLGGNTELFETLLSLKRADCLSQSSLSRERLEICDQIESIYQDILAQDEAFSLRHLSINGSDILALGIPTGPQIGELLNATLNAVIDGEISNEKEPLLAFIQERVALKE